MEIKYLRKDYVWRGDLIFKWDRGHAASDASRAIRTKGLLMKLVTRVYAAGWDQGSEQHDCFICEDTANFAQVTSWL
jgi:hypothetical protein